MSGTIQRAFELAVTGDFKNISLIKNQLYREHYEEIDDHLRGRSIRLQLQRMMKSSVTASSKDQWVNNRSTEIFSDD